MSQETISLLVGTLIGFVSTLLTLVVGYFFQNKLAQRNRKWELEDRALNRRLTILDIRINEVRDYVDTWDKVIKILQQLSRAFRDELNIENIRKLSKDISDGYGNLSLLLKEASRNTGSITILDDPELRELQKKLVLDFAPHATRLSEIADIIEKEHNFVASKDEIEAFSTAMDRAGKLIILMKIRLDKLAQTII